MSRECQFIRAEGRVWVPTPSSWLGGWARHRWLERHFDPGTLSVASCEAWGRLYHENDVYVLIEDEKMNLIEKKIKGKQRKKKKTSN